MKYLLKINGPTIEAFPAQKFSRQYLEENRLRCDSITAGARRNRDQQGPNILLPSDDDNRDDGADVEQDEVVEIGLYEEVVDNDCDAYGEAWLDDDHIENVISQNDIDGDFEAVQNQAEVSNENPGNDQQLFDSHGNLIDDDEPFEIDDDDGNLFLSDDEEDEEVDLLCRNEE